MKTTIITVLFLVSLIQTSSVPEEMKLDIRQSNLKWTGSMFLGMGNHFGNVKFTEGEITITNNRITAGQFVIDMNTIRNTDGEYSDGLVSHLKNEDFFDVPKYPTASLKIVHVNYGDTGKNVMIEANLTIKGITVPIVFPAVLNYNTKEITAQFEIDRTAWGITFNSNSVLQAEDKAIADEIAFEVKLVFL